MEAIVNQFTLLLGKLASSHVVWVLILLALLAAALAAGAPDGGVCPGIASC